MESGSRLLPRSSAARVRGRVFPLDNRLHGRRLPVWRATLARPFSLAILKFRRQSPCRKAIQADSTARDGHRWRPAHVWRSRVRHGRIAELLFVRLRQSNALPHLPARLCGVLIIAMRWMRVDDAIPILLQMDSCSRQLAQLADGNLRSSNLWRFQFRVDAFRY